MLKTFDYKGFLVEAFVLLSESLDRNVPYRKYSDKVRIQIQKYTMLTKKEQEEMYQSMLSLFRKLRWHLKDGKWKELMYRKPNYEMLLRGARRAFSNNTYRVKQDNYLRALNQGFVFFLCSIHNSVADDHKSLEGKLYYSEHWRIHVEPELYSQVLAYIKNHNLMSVEKVTGKPYWLCTRPFCKHFFIEIPTQTVLDSSLNILRRKYQKQLKPIYSDYDYDKFKSEIIESVKTVLKNK